VHGVDENGKVRARKTLAREKVLEYFAQLPACLIGMEACGGAHYWDRELSKLGHTVKLMAAQFVIPYRKRGKNDANDAEAICEAVGRPNMHFVAIKSEEQQSVLMVHRARTLVVVANRTAQVNQIRSVSSGSWCRRAWRGCDASYRAFSRMRRTDCRCSRARCSPDCSINFMTSTHESRRTTIKSVRSPKPVNRHADSCRSRRSARRRRARWLPAWGTRTSSKAAAVTLPRLEITPRQRSSGGIDRLGQITRQGDRYLRTLLVHGARAYLRVVDKKTDGKSAWARRLKERRHINVIAVALAAKHARIAWAMLAKGTEYRPVNTEESAA
jgi:transposase